MPLPTTDPGAYFAALEPYHGYLAQIEAIYLEVAEHTPLP
jgi:hypothetical protein